MRIVPVLLTLVLAASVALAQQSVPPPPQPTADRGPSLEATMQFIQDKVNQQGAIVYVESRNNTVSGTTSSSGSSVESHVVAVDPAGGLSIQLTFKTLTAAANEATQSATGTSQMQFKDVEKIEVLNAIDSKHRKFPIMVFQDDPPYFEILVHLVAGKTVPHHTVRVERQEGQDFRVER